MSTARWLECGIFLQGGDHGTQELFSSTPKGVSHANTASTEAPIANTYRLAVPRKYTRPPRYATYCVSVHCAGRSCRREIFREARIKALHRPANRHIAHREFLRLCLAKIPPECTVHSGDAFRGTPQSCPPIPTSDRRTKAGSCLKAPMVRSWNKRSQNSPKTLTRLLASTVSW